MAMPLVRDRCSLTHAEEFTEPPGLVFQTNDLDQLILSLLPRSTTVCYCP